MTTGPGAPLAVPGPEPFPVRVRLETPGDEPGVRHVNLAAFTGPEEAEIVDRIRREAPDGWHSIVGVGAPGPARRRRGGPPAADARAVEDERGNAVATVLAMGPVAVLPEVQFRGIGSALMSAAMSLAIARMVPGPRAAWAPHLLPAVRVRPAPGSGPGAARRRLAGCRLDGAAAAGVGRAMRGTVRYPAAFEPLA